MGADAEHLHDERAAMLRENDAVHLDMEGSMTPERVKYFVDKAWPMSGGDPLDQSINLVITQAVNEALEEAAKVCNAYGAIYCPTAIRALKLPENI